MIWRNPDTGEEETVVVVAGGSNVAISPSSSSELLFVDRATSAWQKGPSLPQSTEFATMFAFEDSLVLFDGGCVYQLDDPVNGNWTQLPVNVTEPRFNEVAFLIPDNLAECS